MALAGAPGGEPAAAIPPASAMGLAGDPGLADLMDEDGPAEAPGRSSGDEEEDVGAKAAGKQVGAHCSPSSFPGEMQGMLTDEVRAQAKRGRCTEGFRELVMSTLQKHGFEGQRSAKLTLDDFLRLLLVFNRAGIHFSA